MFSETTRPVLRIQPWDELLPHVPTVLELRSLPFGTSLPSTKVLTSLARSLIGAHKAPALAFTAIQAVSPMLFVRSNTWKAVPEGMVGLYVTTRASLHWMWDYPLGTRMPAT